MVKYTKKYANELDLPGGHIKNDENLIQGLKREVFEETGLQINSFLFFDKKFQNDNSKFEANKLFFLNTSCVLRHESNYDQ